MKKMRSILLVSVFAVLVVPRAPGGDLGYSSGINDCLKKQNTVAVRNVVGGCGSISSNKEKCRNSMMKVNVLNTDSAAKDKCAHIQGKSVYAPCKANGNSCIQSTSQFCVPRLCSDNKNQCSGNNYKKTTWKEANKKWCEARSQY